MAISHLLLSPVDYIKHHLINLTQKPVPQTNIVDFSYINLDTIFIALFLGIIICIILKIASKRATSGIPTRFQAGVEILIEFVDNMCKEVVHNDKSRKLIAPLGLTLFTWIVFMNAMDFLPVDFLPLLWQKIENNNHAYLRVVPTSDLNTTLALSLAVLFLCIYYNIKIKGMITWSYDLFTSPFTSNSFIAKLILFIPNFLLNILEFISKTISHAMRLFGNMYAGELVFLLIALLGGSFMNNGKFTILGSTMFLLHLVTGSIWAIFHILIVLLQAFIFMMLTFVYLGQAHDSH